MLHYKYNALRDSEYFTILLLEFAFACCLYQIVPLEEELVFSTR